MTEQSFEELLSELIDEALESLSREDVLSVIELRVYALKEEAED